MTSAKLPRKRMAHVTLRVPQALFDWYRQFPNHSAEMRKALEDYAIRNE